MDFHALIVVAIGLANQPEASDAALRRSVSTIYYACFHRLQRLVASALMPESEGSPAWLRLRRSLEHRQTRNRILAFASDRPSLALYSQLYDRLLNLRHRADYDPGLFDLSKRDVLLLIRQVVISNTALDELSAHERRELAVALLVTDR
jgi:hypothetical protein